MQSDRIYQLRDLVINQPGISMTRLMSSLEASRATVNRGIEALRSRFDCPIVYDHAERGYRIETVTNDGSRRAVKVAELPGLWFRADEAYALLTAQQMLATIEPGLLGNKLKPLMSKINRLLESDGLKAAEVTSRIKVTQAGKRKLHLEPFQVVARATLERKRISVDHFNRQRGEHVRRELSPQRMVHYRDNWYLDAWCHLRNELRSFSVDAMSKCQMLPKDAQEVSDEEIQATMGLGYGIFGGAKKDWAVLRFTPERARWVSREVWHKDQQSSEEADGSYVLKVPYSDERELLGDILRFGPDVEVLEPKALRAQIKRSLGLAVTRYK